MHPHFPMLQPSAHKVTSPATIEYNCIAWAVGDTKTWWWPDSLNQYFWPPEVLREETIDAFVRVFELQGYTICTDANYEKGYEKVAIYAKPGGRPTHAARQINRKKWTSKLGRSEDIEHDINSLSGGVYGDPVVYMKRPNLSFAG